MINIHIGFDLTTFNRWFFALQKVKSMVELQVKDNPYHNAVDMCFLLRHNILTQKYAATYPTFNERYQEWKAKYGKGVGRVEYWNLFGNLLDAIKPTKVSMVGRKGWLAGIPSDAMSSGGQSWFGKGDKGEPKSIAMYGRIAEERRPLFAPTTEEYSETQWAEQGKKSLKKIKQSWS